MKHWRIPIALKLFLTVLLTTLLITTVSLGVLHWTMQKNFSRYVTQVEMQKLDHLNNNLAEIFQVYGNWNTAIQSSAATIQDRLEDRDKSHFPQRWLRRQYDIAQQQSEIIKNPALFQSRSASPDTDLKQFIPSHFDAFAPPPELSEAQLKQLGLQRGPNPSPQLKDNNRRWLIPLPDRLGFGNRLALYDQNKQLVTGDPSLEIPLQPILMDGKVVGYLGLRPALDVDDALSINFFSNQQRYLLLIYGVSIVVSLIVALWLAASFRKPIHRLLNAAQELSNGNYRYHVKVRSNDELGDLSQVINQLAAILDQHEQSRRQWVADTSHELKTPLSVLQAQIEAMQDGVRQPTPEHLSRMMNQVMTLKKITLDLADLAQADAQQLKCYLTQINPWDIVLHEVENFKPQFDQKQLQLSIQGHGVNLISDPDRFRQVIVNLLSNSVRYTEQGGAIAIHTETHEQEWIVHIDDSPLGVSDEQLKQLGERFYRVDDSRTRSTGGTGLGLALSKKIAQILGGDLQFSHSPLGGLRCTVRLNRLKQKDEYPQESNA
ncbi:sensor histidine kinase efflux regulator BaeS [Acinetobacter puyangensis]|uniref:histidine kinase n=1 Tax=Acinetobacter puyangensis TaxID=1096779 RepID=A0A240E6A1_9GAMM|nr:sensor histidine kinase efflux regulator BaeS [Acinetobacter puyangensis]SNX43400.1 two-component system, OmpR family, sensor histidine kinase BaeS [Acinetobacter puyangensis]